jgi:uncharacterized cupin superfamily protein
MEIFNLYHGELDETADADDPPGYELWRRVRVGRKIGASRMGMSIYELPRGQAVCPYHLEWSDEEWLIVLGGTPTLRTPEGERTLEPGDTVCFPAGPDGAHKVSNDADTPARVALLSTKSELGIAEYPDSDKIGVWIGGEQHAMLRRSADLDYFDGER